MNDNSQVGTKMDHPKGSAASSVWEAKAYTQHHLKAPKSPAPRKFLNGTWCCTYFNEGPPSFLYVHTHVCLCVHWYTYMCASQKLSLGVFLCCASPFVLRQSLTEPGPCQASRTPLPSTPCPGTVIVGILHAVPVGSELKSPVFV